MRRPRQPRRWEWLAAPAMLLACAILGTAAAVRSGEPGAVSTGGAPRAATAPSPAVSEPGVKIVFPPDKAVLLHGSFDVIAKAGQADLKVNGSPHPWEPFRAPVHAAYVNLSSGMNSVQIGGQKREFFFARYPGDEDAPKGWPVVKRHPIEVTDGAHRCGACHKTDTVDGLVTVGAMKGYKACLECHQSSRLGKIHSHPLEPLDPCQRCHAVHGATERKLLRAPAKKLCAECHEE